MRTTGLQEEVGRRMRAAADARLVDLTREPLLVLLHFLRTGCYRESVQVNFAVAGGASSATRARAVCFAALRPGHWWSEGGAFTSHVRCVRDGEVAWEVVVGRLPGDPLSLSVDARLGVARERAQVDWPDVEVNDVLEVDVARVSPEPWEGVLCGSAVTESAADVVARMRRQVASSEAAERSLEGLLRREEDARADADASRLDPRRWPPPTPRAAVDALCDALADASRPAWQRAAVAREVGPLFLGLPTRWMDGEPRYRCNGGHVSATVLKSEAPGRELCLMCHTPAWLTFPEDAGDA